MMPIKKIIGWVIVIFLAYYLITRPSGAASAMRGVFTLLKSAGSSLATFLNSL